MFLWLGTFYALAGAGMLAAFFRSVGSYWGTGSGHFIGLDDALNNSILSQLAGQLPRGKRSMLGSFSWQKFIL